MKTKNPTPALLYIISRMTQERLYTVIPETKPRENGAILTQEEIEPLLGNELQETWNDLLRNAGDKVVVTGSTVLAICEGGHSMTIFGKVPETNRADMDIYYEESQIGDNVEELRMADPKHRHDVAIQNNAGVEINGYPVEYAIAVDIQAAADLNAYVEKAGGNSEKVKKINAIATSLKEGSFTEFLKADSTYLHETQGIMLERLADGSIQATIVNATGYFAHEDVQKRLALRNEEYGRIDGPELIENEGGLKAAYLREMVEMENAEFSTLVPMWSVESIPRSIKAAAELDAFRNPEENFDMAQYAVANRIMWEENIFSITTQNGERMKPADIKERLKKTTQTKFAQACATEPAVAFRMLALEYPFGEFLSEEVGEYFRFFHPEQGQEIKRWAPDFSEGYKTPEQDLTIGKFYEMLMLDYGFEEAGVYEGNDLWDTPTFKKVQRESFPRGMSEIAGKLFAAMGWNEAQDREKIEAAVRNWAPKGEYSHYWKTDRRKFNIGMDVEEIIVEMARAKKLWQDYRDRFNQ